MKKSLMVLAVAASMVVVGFVGVAQAQKAKQVVYVSSEKATYTPRPGGGPAMQVLHGDPDKGPHATFTRFELGECCVRTFVRVAVKYLHGGAAPGPRCISGFLRRYVDDLFSFLGLRNAHETGDYD